MPRNKTIPYLGFLLLILSACSSTPRSDQPDANAQRWKSLDDQLDTQAVEIQRLTRTIETLQDQLAAKVRPDAATSPRSLPLTKLVPEAAENEPSIDDADDSGEDTVSDTSQMTGENVLVDSKHEAMPAYYRGVHYFELKNYDSAAREFTAFVKDNPDHVYADRAQYWLTECHFEDHDYGLVVYSSNQLEALYPFSMRVPDAMQKRALALLEMGQPDQAGTVLRELLKRYPDATVSDNASRLLATIAQPRESADRLRKQGKL